MRRLLVVLFVVASFAAQAQSQSTSDRIIDRALRHDTPEGPGLRAAAEEVKNWEFDFGLSYTDSDGPASAWAIPLSLSYSASPESTLTVSSGVIRAHDGSSNSDGLDDVMVGYRYSHKFENQVSASFLGAVILPSGGDVGSTTATQLAQGGMSIPLSSTWSFGASLALVHVDNLPSSIDNTGEVYSVNLADGFYPVFTDGWVKRVNA